MLLKALHHTQSTYKLHDTPTNPTERLSGLGGLEVRPLGVGGVVLIGWGGRGAGRNGCLVLIGMKIGVGMSLQ